MHPLVVLGDFRATVGAGPLDGALERGQLDRPCLENYVPASAIVAALTWWGQCFRCFR
ncbi:MULTISPECIES: hypothetical protein [unclassified Bradyrhizobium]|uniref:hypothetical protein n=1 Tax=unclassified Bradyrhizobium TaxID=2631580 RepID=UPI001FFFBAA1|nr:MULTISPECIES: hypothetical protein [unclassified Bradyrhizobium]UPJ79502.1 hypothetical protein IVB17_33300 [Bradyrhizobium sp. 184]UPJ87298.1 hypothetical protein IVB16_33305 [Bradyrhizobium sp. 183]UPJ95056.1 hypothetical protein IVB07_32765 [Bradyrhizobium sp. 172]